MYSLTQSVGMRGAAGEPLPTPFKGLARLEVGLRRGEFSLAVGGPGTGKSLFALNLAVHGSIPVLYFSADSSAATQVSRATAMITGDDVKAVKASLLAGDFSMYQSALGERWWLRFNYSTRPSLPELEKYLLCYREVNGTSPHLVIVDNISDVYANNGISTVEDYTFTLEGVCAYLSEMARETGAHVLGLHHVTGEHVNGLDPIPLRGVKGQVHRVPSLILTIHKERDGMGGSTLNVSPVKNREGFEDASGKTFASLRLNRTNLRLEDVDTDLPDFLTA